MGVFCRHFVADYSVVRGPIGTKFELVQYIMHVLITCTFKNNWIYNNREKVEKFSDAHGQLTVISLQILTKFELIQVFIYVLITCKYHADRIINIREKVETPFFPL